MSSVTARIVVQRTSREMELTAVNLAPTLKGFPAGFSGERLDEVRRLLDTRRTGFSLEAPFYTDDHLFNLDMQALSLIHI